MNKKLKDESGIALITALLIMVLITVLGTAAIMTSTTDVKIGENFKKSLDAFYIAEAGLEVGLDYLDNNFNAATGWSTLVNTGENDITSTPGNDITTRVTGNPNVGNGSFILFTRDDADTSTNSDDNLRIYLRSVGSLSGPIAAKKTLETYVEFDQGYDSYGGKDLTSGNTNVASGKATWGS